MTSAPSAAASSIWQRVSRFLHSLTSSSKIPTPAKPVDHAPTRSTPRSHDEIRVDVPLFTVPFGGAVQGVDFIPVRAPTLMRYPMTSGFGMREDPISGEQKLHKGIDLGTPVGVPLHPPEDGKVVTAGFKDDGAGRRVVILHAGRPYPFYTAYFHLSEIHCAVGDKMTRETSVGLSGGDPDDPKAGRTTNAHTHFETRIDPGYTPIRPVLIWRA